MDFADVWSLVLTESPVPLLRMHLRLQTFAAVTSLAETVISSNSFERIYVIAEKFRLKFVVLVLAVCLKYHIV